MQTFFYYTVLIILIYFIILSLGYTILLAASFFDIVKNFKVAENNNFIDQLNQSGLVPVTVIMPVYNAEIMVMDAILSALESNYKSLELIIVNDGSSDKTLQKLIARFELFEVAPVIKQVIKTAPVIAYYKSRIYPHLTVIDKEHYGSADTVNVGVNACRTPLYLTLDSDTVIEPQSITQLIYTFLSHPHCIAVGGAIYIQNECRIENGTILTKKIPSRFVTAQQTCEYLRSFLYGRSGWNKFGGTLCYPGAFTLYETQVVIESGGYDRDNYSYDVEIIMKLHAYMREHQYPYTIYYAPNAFAWCEEPDTLRRYWKQRNRWQRGMLRSVFRYKRLFFNYHYKMLGFLNYPFYLLFEVFGPIVEFISVFLVLVAWYLDIMNVYAVIIFFILACCFNVFLTTACILLNAITFNVYRTFLDAINMFSMSVVEMLGFHQYRAACCFFAFIQYSFNRLRGKSQ